ncbi:MAG TPA: tRNA epoxyqueuosine(34) reductase QueG, partial [Acidobacteriota bacterium]
LELARECGFDRAGVAGIEPGPETEFLRRWLEQGYHGAMAYLERRADERVHLERLLPGVRAAIVVALDYDSAEPYSTDRSRDPERGWISRYAWGQDYHEVMRPRLERLRDRIDQLAPDGSRSKIYVDTGPVLERALAARAGLGWFGKSTNLLHPDAGSLFFIGVVLTTLELEPDQPLPDRCGSCTACIDACPTAAILPELTLDARRCISYLTIELRGPIPEALRAPIGDHVFGCDICQDVCPWVRRFSPAGDPAFAPRPDLRRPELAPLLELTREQFAARFGATAVARAKYAGLLRNVAVAMGNSGDRGFIPALQRALEHAEPLVREHAAWALERLRAYSGGSTPPENSLM